MKNKEELTEFGKELMGIVNKHLEKADNISLINPKEGGTCAVSIVASCLSLTLSVAAGIALKLDYPELFNDLPDAFNQCFKKTKKLYQKEKAELDKLNKEG